MIYTKSTYSQEYSRWNYIGKSGNSNNAKAYYDSESLEENNEMYTVWVKLVSTRSSTTSVTGMDVQYTLLKLLINKEDKEYRIVQKQTWENNDTTSSEKLNFSVYGIGDNSEVTEYFNKITPESLFEALLKKLNQK
ncbi:MAG: hypothetical protein JSS63_09905 [Bacteroidetes bacterium]|nr:hypothetical protein [Bacteroidota bacterium]